MFRAILKGITGGAFMEQRQKSYLLNAFLLGVITGFFIAPLKNGIQVHVSSRGTCSPKK